MIGIPGEDVIAISAKTGENVEQVLEAVVRAVPPPSGDPDAPLRALIFDSHYDAYKGVIAYVRVFDGAIREHDWIKLMSNGVTVEPLEVGIFSPRMKAVPRSRRRGRLHARASRRCACPRGRHVTLRDRPPPSRCG